MTDLEKVISTFDNWGNPWEFQEFVLSSGHLSESDKATFKDIWAKAGDSEIWQYSDLVLGCKACHKYIKENFNLSDEATALITRAISYDWR